MNYKNIGGKIQALAETLAILGGACSVVCGIYIANGDMLMRAGAERVLVGVAVCVAGVLLSWLSSFVLYGFGQLIVNTEIQLCNDERKLELLESIDRKLTVCLGQKDTEKEDT